MTPLKNFGVGEPGVGHVRVDRRSPIVTGSSTRPATDRLVILMSAVSKGEVVHRSLAGGRYPQCTQQRIRDGLPGLNIPGHDGSRILRCQHAAFGDDDLDRFQATFVQRNSIVDQATENIQNR